MSDIVHLFFIILLVIVGMVAYFLVINALFGGRVTRIRSAAQSMPGRSLGVGFVNFLFFAVIALALLSVAENMGPFLRGILTIPALLILAFLAIILSLGLAGMTTLVGERLFPDLPAWTQTLWGTVCVSLACALPFVGWFLLFPYISFVGIGAVILGLIQREKL